MMISAEFFGQAFRRAWKSVTTYSWNVAFQFLGNILTTVMLYFFWSALFAEQTVVEGFDRDTMILYAVASIFFSILLYHNIENELAQQIYRGDIALKLSQPMAYPKVLIIEGICNTGVNVLLKGAAYIGAAGILIIIGSVEFTITPSLFLIPSLILAYVIHLMYSFVFGTVVFWTMEIHGILYAREFVMLALSGSFIPLWFFPEWLKTVSLYLPFRYMYHSPLSMLVGKLTGTAALRELSLQALWLMIMVMTAAFLWKRAVREVVVHGG